ncbi:MAG: methyltransferase [Aeromicrobium sp.]|nr:methyltransferase [Aeromicrobium sp.]
MTDAPTRPGRGETMRFGGLEIAFDDRVLKPRDWTLAQSEWAAERQVTAPPGPVLEVCAGVGHMGLVATATSGRELVLVDLNPVACAFARSNVAAAGADGRVEIREGRMEDVLDEDETFAVIIADPPWVVSAGIDEFPDDPPIAIDGGADGLELARACCRVIDAHLAAGGSAVLQLGSAEQVEQMGLYLDAQLGSDVKVVETRTFDRGALALLTR